MQRRYNHMYLRINLRFFRLYRWKKKTNNNDSAHCTSSEVVHTKVCGVVN